MIITFNLVRNATWHDGVPFTSADVKYTLDYLNEKKPTDTMGFYATKGWIDHIETPDAYTVNVHVNRTSLFIIPGLGLVSMMPKHIWEGTDWQAIYDPLNATMNVGTGPWKFKDRVEGEYLRYERYPNYYYSPMGWPTPVASFTYAPSEPALNQAVNFDASDSYHPNGTITSYSWNFGDGTTAPGIIANHAYASAGNYTVVLNVTDSEGLWSTETKFVDVQAPPPEIPWLWVGVGVVVIVVVVGAAVFLWTRKGKPS